MFSNAGKSRVFASYIMVATLLISLQQMHSAQVVMELQWTHSHLFELRWLRSATSSYILATYHRKSLSLFKSSSSELLALPVLVEVPDDPSESDALGSKL